MNLESLVPPLELCKQIPEGKFADSALVWNRHRYVSERETVYLRGIHGVAAPAPTLQEIMAELYSEADGCCELVNCYIDRSGWEVEAEYECHDDSGYGGRISPCSQDGNNPAAAALKLWLKEQNNKNEKGN